MFFETLKTILADLNKIEYRSKDELLKTMIQNTLDVSYDRYCNNLKVNYDYLLTRSNLKVLKTLKRQQEQAIKKQQEELKKQQGQEEEEETEEYGWNY